MKTYKAITLHQPWASWIAWKLKTIETRTHDRFAGLVGQRIAIHAGLSFDNMAMSGAWAMLLKEVTTQTADDRYDAVFRMLNNVPPNGDYRAVFAHGHVLCLATVTKTRPLMVADERAALCDFRGKYGLFLTDVVKLAEPVPAKGKQGIWEVEI